MPSLFRDSGGVISKDNVRAKICCRASQGFPSRVQIKVSLTSLGHESWSSIFQQDRPITTCINRCTRPDSYRAQARLTCPEFAEILEELDFSRLSKSQHSITMHHCSHRFSRAALSWRCCWYEAGDQLPVLASRCKRNSKADPLRVPHCAYKDAGEH